MCELVNLLASVYPHLAVPPSETRCGLHRISIGKMFLRRFGPALSKVKDTTGLVGLDVVPNAREVLIGLYNETLNAVKVIPENAVYRQNVERTTRYRLSICEQERDWEAVEAKVNAGQIEELIEQAKDELTLIPKMSGKYVCPNNAFSTDPCAHTHPLTADTRNRLSKLLAP